MISLIHKSTFYIYIYIMVLLVSPIFLHSMHCTVCISMNMTSAFISLDETHLIEGLKFLLLIPATTEVPQPKSGSTSEPQTTRRNSRCKRICLVAVYRPPVNRYKAWLTLHGLLCIGFQNRYIEF